jgi:hypothetical protein
VSGAIQFSNGSAFASDATNLFWDDTNDRLGVGTNAPQSTTEIKSTGNQLSLSNSADIYTYVKFSALGGFASMIFGDGNGTVNYLNNYASGMWASNKFAFGPSYFTPSGQVHIKGSGSTSATTSLLVQNSAGTQLMSVRDDGVNTMQKLVLTSSLRLTNINTENDAYTSIYLNGSNGNAYFPQTITIGAGLLSPNASAKLQVDSTTSGFLPPRMTTTQRNAIASPAEGLMIYNTTTAKLNVFTTAWEAITSL